jgi:hypothetical protein
VSDKYGIGFKPGSGIIHQILENYAFRRNDDGTDFIPLMQED